jgi:hypothetical protein
MVGGTNDFRAVTREELHDHRVVGALIGRNSKYVLLQDVASLQAIEALCARDACAQFRKENLKADMAPQ